MTSIDNLARLNSEIPASVNLVVVTKNQSPARIQELYDAGQRVFGENKVQELLSKVDRLPSNIAWHFIGHLQRNKVKFITPFITLIHSIDSLRLLEEVNDEASKVNRIIECLLQFHIASEETKYGLDLPEGVALLGSPSYKGMKHIKITGIMGIATLTDDSTLIEREFGNLISIYRHLKKTFFPLNSAFREISMGMSGDYRLAIRQGSTMIRVGTMIFGGN